MSSVRAIGTGTRLGRLVCKAREIGIFCAAMCAMAAAGQTPTPPAATSESGSPLLTLGTPMLRSAMERVNLAWVFPEKMPDFRLKMDRPTWDSLSRAEMEGRLRGLEIRLPVEGLWVGYEKTDEGEDPRVTFSIQRGF
jgi:hypothetical protein